MSAAVTPRPTEAAEPAPKVSIILSKGSLDMAYPALIMANAARMNGIEVNLFFTFWGLDVVNKKKMADLHLQLIGNTSMPMPTMLAGLPGVEHIATAAMRKQMERLDIPSVAEFIPMLKDAGAKLYACALAKEMFKLDREDLAPEIDGVISAGEFFDMSVGGQIIFV